MGVCGGLGEYFEVDSLIFRALFVLLSFSGAGIVLYFVMAILVPNAPLFGQSAAAFGTPGNEGEFKTKLNEFAAEMKQSAQNLADEAGRRPRRHSRGNIFGLLLILLGLVLLVQKLFPQAWFRWDIFWPGLIIFLGLAILFRRK